MSDLRKRFSLDYLVSTKKETSTKLKYKIVLVDIDSSTFPDTVDAYSFEDALERVRAKFPGYGIQSVERANWGPKT